MKLTKSQEKKILQLVILPGAFEAIWDYQNLLAKIEKLMDIAYNKGCSDIQTQMYNDGMITYRD